MQPMNLLLIMSDEHRRQVLGAFGNAQARTPNLDALAAGGARFDNAYCNFPICVPSRASFAAGRYAHALGAWDNAAPYTGQAPSWGHRLTAAGHHVTTIGKLHFRGQQDDSGFPDQRIPMHIKDGTGDLFGCLRPDVPHLRNALGHVATSGPGDSDYIRYDQAIADQAVHWLHEDAAQLEQPWCLWVSFSLPHFPFIAPPRHFDQFTPADLPLPIQGRAAEWPAHPHISAYRADRIQTPEEEMGESVVRRTVAAYYGMCAYLDEQIGRVLRALKAAGQADRTRILYTSDHGEILGDFGLWGKNVMYEGSAAVPLILSGPDVRPGTRITSPVSLVDSFPTVLDCLDVPLESDDAELAGTSLWPAAAGESLTERTIFSEYHASGSRAAVFMLRQGRHKYVHHVGFPSQLFDLERDPDERHDLALPLLPDEGQSASDTPPLPEGADRGEGKSPSDESPRVILDHLESELRRLVDPEALDVAAKTDQRRRLDLHGGEAAIRAAGAKVSYSPPPDVR